MAKTAIITGASRGIGRSIAMRLAVDGFSIAVNYSSNAGAAEEVVRAIESAGGRALAVAADVSQPGEVEELFIRAEKELGPVEAVVNSAGIMPMSRVEDCEISKFDSVIATNLRGAFVVLAHAARHLGQGGRIVVLSSSVVAKSFPGYGPYIASKAGVEGLVRVLANELRGRGVTVNAVAPGPTATELFLRGKSQVQVEDLKKAAPLERLGQPEDIASVVSFLVGPEGGWINGQVVRANGGFA